MESELLSSSPCTDPDLLCKQSRFSCGWLHCLVTSQKVAQTFLMEKAQDCLAVPPVFFFFCCLQYGVPHEHKPSWRTEQRALGRGSSLESLHSLHKCLKRVMPTLHLPCPSPSYTVYFLFRHPLGGSSPQMCAVNLGTFGNLDRALLLEGSIIHQHLQMPIGNRWLSQLQQQAFVLFFFLCLTPSSWVSS